MKAVLILLATALFSSLAFADDLADAKKAFATLDEYQKTDDERSPDLFSKDCVVIFTFSDGTNQKTANIPIEAFIEEMKKEIAKKKGSQEKYEDVKYSQEDSGIRTTGNVLYPKSGRKGPFSLLYRRDADGLLRIHEFKATVFVNE